VKKELLISDDKAFYVVNATFRKNGYVRAGALICVNTAQQVATFTLSDRKLRLGLPAECLDRTLITKTFNIDLPILDDNE
jgi:hypothetical protein